jgi:hypothetical protein
MENSQKFWKYMDLAKFISLLSKEALYFACPSEFYDPLEGYIPKIWAKDYAINNQQQNRELFESLRNHVTSLPPMVDSKNIELIERANQSINDGSNIVENLWEVIREEVISDHGVSCWHKSNDESEAMWKLYSASGQGIAIESTIGQLTDSILDKENLVDIKSVNYFSENNPGKYNGQLDPLFLKRNSFEHEKELRAAISLKTKGKGTFVKCDLYKLISHIHVSPLAEPYFRDVVENICKGKVRSIDKPVTRSTLFDKPNYKLNALLAL